MAILLGDAFAKFTRLIGLRQCKACKLRQKALNLIDYKNQSLVQTLNEVSEAIKDPYLFSMQKAILPTFVKVDGKSKNSRSEKAS